MTAQRLNQGIGGIPNAFTGTSSFFCSNSTGLNRVEDGAWDIDGSGSKLSDEESSGVIAVTDLFYRVNG